MLVSKYNMKHEDSENYKYFSIIEQVVILLETDRSAWNLSVEGLIDKGCITRDDYEYMQKHNIIYNPPSSAGPNDNFVSIFDKKNADGTTTYQLFDLVDRNDRSITRRGFNTATQYLC